MAFYSKKFVKLTGKWVPVVKSVSNYDAKRLAKDIEKESTVSQTDVMAVASWDNHCDALTVKGRNTIVFLPFLCFYVDWSSCLVFILLSLPGVAFFHSVFYQHGNLFVAYQSPSRGYLKARRHLAGKAFHHYVGA